MSCDILSGFTLGCRDNTGGIKALYILGPKAATPTVAPTFAVTSTDADGVIDGITGDGTFYQFQLFRQTSNYAEEITATPENGTVFYNQTCQAVFFKMKQAVRNQINTLAQNPNLVIVVETNNGATDDAVAGRGVGRFFLMGQNNGSQLLTGTGQSGTAFGDLNGYNLTFTGQEPFPASELLTNTGDPASFSAILTGIDIDYGPF